MEMHLPYLVIHKKNYKIRRRVPSDLSGFFSKREFNISLKTSNPDIARARYYKQMLEIEKQINKARHTVLVNELENPMTLAAAEAAPKLRDAFEKYKAAHEKLSKSIYKEQRHINYFIEYAGNISLNDIKRRTIAEWRNLLTNFPERAGAKKEFQKLSFLEIINKNKKLRQKTICNNTINKYLSSLSNFFRWAIHNCYMDNNNPVYNLFNQKQPETEREIYTRQDIHKLFSYLQRYRGTEEEYLWWIPRISMYSGARQKEICQLLCSDIIKRQGVWCFSINQNNDRRKSVKNRNSQRLIPIHDQLLKDGILQYRQQRQKKNNDKLFAINPKFGPDKRWTYALNYGRLYKTDLEKAGIKRPLLDFHSWRHTFITELRNRGVYSKEIPFIVGHKEQTMTDNYGDGEDNFPLKQWQKLVNKAIFADTQNCHTK